MPLIERRHYTNKEVREGEVAWKVHLPDVDGTYLVPGYYGGELRVGLGRPNVDRGIQRIVLEGKAIYTTLGPRTGSSEALISHMHLGSTSMRNLSDWEVLLITQGSAVSYEDREEMLRALFEGNHKPLSYLGYLQYAGVRIG